MASERPIIFTGESVRSIRAGTKTQTRRIMKPQPTDEWNPEVGVFCQTKIDGKDMEVPGPEIFGAADDGEGYRCPFGAPRDMLWLREAFAEGIAGCPNGITYRADHMDKRGDGPTHPIKWKSPIFMPRALSRVTLEIKSVRVERVQDISQADAVAEDPPSIKGLSERDAYCGLWGKINGPDSWAANPWVWVVEFVQTVGRAVLYEGTEDIPKGTALYYSKGKTR